MTNKADPGKIKTKEVRNALRYLKYTILWTLPGLPNFRKIAHSAKHVGRIAGNIDKTQILGKKHEKID